MGKFPHILFLLIGMFMIYACAAQSYWKKSDPQTFLKSINGARSYLSEKPTYAFKIKKIMSSTGAEKKVLNTQDLKLYRNDKLLLLQSKELRVMQSKDIMVSYDSLNQIIILDKPTTLKQESMLGKDIDASIGFSYKSILRLETTEDIKYKVKFMDESDSTILHDMEIDFNKASGFISRSAITFGADAEYELNNGKVIKTKLKTETIFIVILQARPINENDLGLPKYISISENKKISATKRSGRVKLIDQRVLRK